DDVFVFLVSFAQRRLWLIDQLEPGNAAYNIPAVVRFEGALDFAALEAAVNTIVARHETLRTNVTVLDGEPKQVVTGARHVALQRIDLGGDETRLLPLVERETLTPFNLASDPLLRVLVYRLGDRRHVVQLTIHH